MNDHRTAGSDNKPTSCWVEVARWRTHVLQAGHGPATLLWFPAVGDSSFSAVAMFGILADLLQGQARLRFCDPPGYGFSKIALLSMTVQMQWAVELANLEQGPLIVVGNSSGGVCACAVAEAMPERVRGMALVGWPDPNCGMPSPERLCPTTLEQTDTLLQSSWYRRPPVDPARIHAQLSLPEYQAHMRSISAQDSIRAYDAYPGPICFLGGTSDGLVPPGLLRASAARRPGSTVTILEKCGHYPHRERPRVFAKILARFVAQCLRARL